MIDVINYLICQSFLFELFEYLFLGYLYCLTLSTMESSTPFSFQFFCVKYFKVALQSPDDSNSNNKE